MKKEIYIFVSIILLVATAILWAIYYIYDFSKQPVTDDIFGNLFEIQVYKSMAINTILSELLI